MRRTIKFDNKTDWSTRELRSLVLKVAHTVVPDGKLPLINVDVINRRGGGADCQVTAWKGSHKLQISLPKDAVDSLGLCCSLAWGLGYCLGKTNSYMVGPCYRHGPQSSKHHPYAASIHLVKLAKKAKATGAAYYTEQAMRLQAKVDYWERKLKLATTKLRKYKKKLAFCDKKAMEKTMEWASLPGSTADIYKDGPAGAQD